MTYIFFLSKNKSNIIPRAIILTIVLCLLFNIYAFKDIYSFSVTALTGSITADQPPNSYFPDAVSVSAIMAGNTLTAAEEEKIFKTSAVTGVELPYASGKVTYNNEYVIIDASNTSEGYVMLKYIGPKNNMRKIVQITSPNGAKYSYVYSNDDYAAYPLSEGNGEYSIKFLEDKGNNKATLLNGKNIKVSIKDDIVPFLYPNSYVNYNGNTKVVKIAAYLTKDLKNDIKKIEAIFTYVINTLKYDYELAKSVKSGYVPVLDTVISKKSGICFDYSAVMTAMLRSVGIPAKMIFGYSGSTYHAWINTYTAETGWIGEIIKFDGKSWKLMDPTYASSLSTKEAFNKYVGDGKNYQAAYTY